MHGSLLLTSAVIGRSNARPPATVFDETPADEAAAPPLFSVSSQPGTTDEAPSGDSPLAATSNDESEKDGDQPIPGHPAAAAGLATGAIAFIGSLLMLSGSGVSLNELLEGARNRELIQEIERGDKRIDERREQIERQDAEIQAEE